jgi:type IV secretory pathway component VirB8
MAKLNKHNLTPEDYKEISRMVESGEIFNDARDWYLRTYLLLTIERSWLIVLMAALLFLIFSAYDYRETLLPVKTSYPVMVSIEDSSRQVSKLTKLGDREQGFDINEIYLKLLSSLFIESFESYDFNNDFENLKNNAKIINSLAKENILDDFNDRISVRKINSLTLKYRKNTVRKIEVNKNSLQIEPTNQITDGKRKYNASGSFTATEITGSERVTSEWSFKIVLYFHDINYNFEKKQFDDLYFKAFSYEANKK